MRVHNNNTRNHDINNNSNQILYTFFVLSIHVNIDEVTVYKIGASC